MALYKFCIIIIFIIIIKQCHEHDLVLENTKQWTIFDIQYTFCNQQLVPYITVIKQYNNA